MYCYYTCKVERPDGSIFEQGYNDFYQLIDFYLSLGDGYLIVDIY